MQGKKDFFYDRQLKSYVLQFMAIFADMYVQFGKSETADERLVRVPIVYGSQDRVVAAIVSENTQNKPIRLPAMSAYMTGLTMSPELRKGVGMERRKTNLPTGGIFPDDIDVVHQRQPVPYKATFDLTLWASNTDQHFQILEQILMLFDPTLQIQTSDDVFDWTQITTVELNDIRYEENNPPGVDRRIIQTTLSFTCNVYISAPADVRKDFIKHVLVRVGVVSNMNQSNYDIIAELDQLGFEYQEVFSLDNVDIGD